MYKFLYPIDTNPAIAAHAVFPQSGRSRPEKRPFFHIFPHYFSQYTTLQKEFTAYRCPIYHIEANEIPFQMKLFLFDK